MLPLLLLLQILRGYNGPLHPAPFFVWLFLLVSMPLSLAAQKTRRVYHAIREGKTIGQLVFTEEWLGSTRRLLLESAVDTRFLVRIHLKAHESASFHHDRLVQSSIRRVVNGHTRVDQELVQHDGRYLVRSMEGKRELPFMDIRHTILSLYAALPAGIREVYSDNYGRMIRVEKLSEQVYRIKLPNGSSSIFHYKGNVCEKMEVKGTAYELCFRLQED